VIGHHHQPIEKPVEKPVVESDSVAAETSGSEKDEIIKSLKEQLAVLEKQNADLSKKNLILQDSKSGVLLTYSNDTSLCFYKL